MPAPRYTYQDRCRPTFLPTVIRVGGTRKGLRRTGASAGAGTAGAPPSPVPTAGAGREVSAANCLASLDFGMPSSETTAINVSGSPTRTERVLSPSSATIGGLFARTSGLLEPAPSAPVSDAFTTSSTL